jgi:hypothetical protein
MPELRTRGTVAVWAVLGLLSAASPGAIHPQVGRPVAITGRFDVGVLTRDRWRGIRRNAHPVTHIDGMAGVLLGDVSVSAGVWASVEPGSTSGELLPDLRAGEWGTSQWSLWTQLAYRRGPLLLAGGVLRDEYVRPADNPAVTEVYGSARFQAGRWSPSVSLWHAVDGAEGAYLEPAIAFHHFVNPFTGPAISWITAIRAGVQLSERNPEAGNLVPGPAETGLTHVALGTGVRVALNIGWELALVLGAGVEAQINVDPATKRHRDGTDAGDFRLWAPLHVGISLPLRRPE